MFFLHQFIFEVKIYFKDHLITDSSPYQNYLILFYNKNKPIRNSVFKLKNNCLKDRLRWKQKTVRVMEKMQRK